MGEWTTILLGISMVILVWTVAKINEKVDKQVRKFKRFEEALKKNATGRVHGDTSDSRNKSQAIYR